ncbi:hypothetical protein M758_8G096700 [Ceratodon purpureus]|uniref:Uncharacterized protein n=1 Tax=Ceratodon purpureus TaxID=3225 RepID=A0A8T0H0Q8_CERPU|nr:hypothetical protein KC19_8G101000 [Ceratodon purpureus]KAG0608319.1 hypothetical protein M758_8G096700 [Ceratodon purpureus]
MPVWKVYNLWRFMIQVYIWRCTLVCTVRNDETAEINFSFALGAFALWCLEAP